MLLIILSVIIAIFLYGFLIEPEFLMRTDLAFEFRELAKSIKIIQVSDLHATRISRPFRKTVEVIKQEKPDFVFITGDFVGYRKVLSCTDFLSKITEVCPRTFAVLGNWDHKVNNLNGLIQEIEATGIKLLTNESVLAKGIYIAGVDDPYRNMDNLAEAFRKIPTGSFVILLAHSPDIVYRALPYRPKLILAGHLHGGQVSIPFLKFALYSPSKYWIKFLRGLYGFKETYMYVNRGIGESHLRIRICSP
ncbi:MAG: metallophosphoesterase, partial [Caldisericaceae bacterium]